MEKEKPTIWSIVGTPEAYFVRSTDGEYGMLIGFGERTRIQRISRPAQHVKTYFETHQLEPDTVEFRGKVYGTGRELGSRTVTFHWHDPRGSGLIPDSEVPQQVRQALENARLRYRRPTDTPDGFEDKNDFSFVDDRSPR